MSSWQNRTAREKVKLLKSTTTGFVTPHQTSAKPSSARLMIQSLEPSTLPPRCLLLKPPLVPYICMYVRKVHTYVASAFSVNETFQIMGPSKGGTQGVPISVGTTVHTYVLRVPYSCGVASVFVLLAGNSFWYVRTCCGVVLVLLVMAGNSFFGVRYVHSVQYSCAVVFLKNDYSVSLF